MKNRGLNVYACVGNRARVMTGQAAGARGVVTGKSGRFSNRSSSTSRRTGAEPDGGGRPRLIRAEGVGMRPDRPSRRAAARASSPNCSPRARRARKAGRVAFGVVRRIPAHLAGAGLGLTSEGGTSTCSPPTASSCAELGSTGCAWGPGGARGHRQPLQPRLSARGHGHRRRLRHRWPARRLRARHRRPDDRPCGAARRFDRAAAPTSPIFWPLEA